ncbi:dienelactone hydrolase family protein [Caldilinea sp.]|jgi:carboxymethylenebutenolidase|uniref:dienelactone hydrolase family protein n=1 Tax=Caldilinea sp. TaxID=2293560 RepID=UPI0021DBE5C2|nr:dienelactone hydrolase family protein [Caldilinea sp.]GIV70006.1 MAG: carboxymethylenebutenolidase [Caldilinea sp.]
MDRIYVMQLVRSFQIGEIDRRTFLSRATAAIGSFSAASLLLAACQPVSQTPRPVTEPTPSGEGVGSPETSMTTEEGLVAGRVEYPGPDGETLSGYWARPQGEGSWPAVVVLQEWWGVNEHIMDVARRIAAQGYVALAPDLYKGQIATEPDEARKLVMELDMAAAVEEIGSAIDFLLAQEFVRGEKVGVVGFCMGGRLTLMTALANDKLAVAVPFYGAPLTPEEAAQVKAPVLGLYGAEDSGIPVDAVLAMGEALTAAGIDNEIHIYEGAPHAFFNDTRASYRPEAAADAWERMLQWFEKYLKSS